MKNFIVKSLKRKRTWLYSMSEGDIELNYLKNQHTITLGTFEMVLLNVYHNNNSVTCKELMERTKLKVSISDDDQDPGGLEPVVGSS